ncbi:MAG: oligosaccharide flippase family protein [bacterium]
MPQSILANTIIASSGRVVNVALGVFVLSLVSRFLGVATYGSYALLLSYGAILQIAADFGLYLTLTHAISRHPGQENYYISHIASLRLILLLTIFGFGWLLTLITPSLRSLVPIYPIIALGFMAQSFSQLMMGIYQKYGVVWRATAGDLAGRLVQVAGIILVGAASATLASMTTLFTLGLVVATYFHRRLLPPGIRIRPAFSQSAWRKILITSWPLGAVLIFNVIYFRIDTIILSLFRPARQVGLYGLAYRLIESSLFVPAMFGGLLLPHLTAAWHEQRLDAFRRYFEQGATLTIWTAVFITLTLVLFAEPVIILIAGTAFIDATILLQILGPALGVMFFGNLAGFSLVACRRHKTLLVIAASLAGINIILNLIFIPPFGAPAAALTTLLTEIIATLSASFVLWRLARVSLSLTYLARLAFVAITTSLIYVALPASWPVLITIAIGAAVYCAASWFTRLISKKSIGLLIKT